jgi:hypothetical protein
MENIDWKPTTGKRNIATGYFGSPNRQRAPQYDPNAPRNALGVRYDADKYAMDTQTAMARDQWDNYLRMFMPIENNLIQYATDIRKPQEAADKAIGLVGSAFEGQEGSSERQRRAYGITLRPDEEAAIDRQSNLNESLAKVQAGNAVRDATIGRQRAILGSVPSGGMPA